MFALCTLHSALCTYIYVGISVHGTEKESIRGNSSSINMKKKKKHEVTYYEMFLQYWWHRFPFYRFKPGLLHRLDADVSGVMVFAKRQCAQTHFNKLLNGQLKHEYLDGFGVKKCYVAICEGLLARNAGSVEGNIRRDHKNYKRFKIYPHKAGAIGSDSKDAGKGAVSSSSYCHTRYQVIDVIEHGKLGVLSVVMFTLLTGRQHQLRATAAWLKCPILGDVLYDGSRFPRMMLHGLFVGFEGMPHADTLYSAHCLPKWNQWTNIWTTKAQYHTNQFLNGLIKRPRPSKLYVTRDNNIRYKCVYYLLWCIQVESD